MSKKNGIVPDVYENTNNLQDILANNDVNFKERGACADNILSGVLEETLLSKYFFSTENILNLQKMMRYYFFKKYKVVIDEQSNNILLTIMRGIFLKYSNSGATTIPQIQIEIQKLNSLVTEYNLQKIYSNYEMHNKYMSDIQNLPDPLPLPVNNFKKNTTFDLSADNDLSTN